MMFELPIPYWIIVVESIAHQYQNLYENTWLIPFYSLIIYFIVYLFLFM